MPTFDYAEIREVAEELLEEFGQGAVLNVPTRTGPEWAPVEGVAPHPVTVVDLEQMARVAGNGSLVVAVTRTVIISTRGLTVAPSSDSTITIRGRTHQIEELAELSPGGLTLLWEAKLGAAESEEGV